MISSIALEVMSQIYTLEPATTALLIQGGIQLGGTLLGGLLSDDTAKKLQEEVLNERLNQAKRLKRQALGQFTSEERAMIRTGAEPTLTQIQGNLAERGISQSGAGGQIIAQAQQRPFLQAQAQAAAGINPALMGASQAATQLSAIEQAENQALFSDLNRFAKSMMILQGLKADPNSSFQGNSDLDNVADIFFKNLDAIRGQGFTAEVG